MGAGWGWGWTGSSVAVYLAGLAAPFCMLVCMLCRVKEMDGPRA
jgi:hypothetical protein